MIRDRLSSPVNATSINSTFWSSIMETTRTQMLPYQWKVLNDQIADIEPSHCIENFRIVAGEKEGEFYGACFQDSDVAKWIEAASYALEWHPDEQVERKIDETIDLIVKAQQPDGYIGTYYALNGLDQRWSNVTHKHELYCAGHMLEAAIAYYKSTGKDKLLQAMIRFVDHIDSVFGSGEGKLNGYPGHALIEMALVKLFNVTGDQKHLKLAQYFIDERGQSPNFYYQESEKYGRSYPRKGSYIPLDYYQASMPVRQQKEAVGHAVRAVYLYSGMADVARETNDQELFDACKAIWKNIVNRKMYITGAIGSSEHGEAFTFDYDLPNDLVYGETCASVGFVFFAHRMFQLEPKGEYGDIMERLLYNGSLCGMSLDGKRFFYVNPLEVHPRKDIEVQPFRHVKTQRQEWFACACCPPNLARMIESIGHYIYTERQQTLFINLYIGSTVEAFSKEAPVQIDMRTSYPWTGDVDVEVGTERNDSWELALRLPDWCKDYTLEVDGKPCEHREENGFLYILKNWNGRHRVLFKMDMQPKVIQCHPLVRENVGKAAVMRGPVVYCLEEVDNGDNLHLLEMKQDSGFTQVYRGNLLGGVVVLESEGRRLKQDGQDDLYQETSSRESVYEPALLQWVPYYSWNNRGNGEMAVWMRCSQF